jgi:limonene 1,2-monooxygenase
MAVPGRTVREMIDLVNETGLGAVGTPDMVAGQIDRLWKQSNGGFGAYLMLAHEWANPSATRLSYDLIAQHVMPRFQGQAQATLQAAERARAVRPELAEKQNKAVEAMRQKYDAERGIGR